ncbi:MAG TPA: alpha-L-fucosidase, partial [Balneolaceae bacterium]|nr:alpha-L-fucosidase [Balneolaceae bacterium]
MKAKHFLFVLAIMTCVLWSFRQNTYKNAWPGITPDSVHPSPQQIAYQKKEKIAFIHFGMNTFTNKEWGKGDADPSLFNPTDLDADQWAKTLSENGFKTLILTAKHHDGFCLWPSDYTDYDIANSPFKNGNGDIVKEVSEACRKYNIDFGIYLSPWDRHEKSYGTAAYNDFYANQLKELLTEYGKISEVWFDGAKGKNAKDMHYDFKRWWSIVRRMQPDAVIFSDKGPDVRWIGNENGFAGKTNWSTIDRSKITIGKAGQGDYLNSGEQGAPDWVTGECDVSIRPGWFYHPKENDQLKTVSELTNIYLKSVGRNGTLLLNIPPDKTGRIHPTDVRRLANFTDTLRTMFDHNLASSARVEASSSGKDYPASNIIDGNW